MELLRHYRLIWCVDFEFRADPGERQEPLCVVAREVRSGCIVRRWLTDGAPPIAPFDTGTDSLFVAYYASAELGCFLALGWPMPARILDLFTEFRNGTNGLELPHGRGLLGALLHHGLPAIDTTTKDAMRDLALRHGDHNEAERLALLDYCQSDVDALAALLPAMAPRLDLPRALLRGRYMVAVARMEFHGVPIDVDTLDRVRRQWEPIKTKLIEAIDPRGEIYIWTRSSTELRTFSSANFSYFLARHGIAWRRLESGALDLSDEAFREGAKLHPDVIGPLRELRHALSQLRLNELAVGADGRNRCLLSAFASKTGRNQPSNSKFIFGPAVWLRSLIRPEQGRALAYIDWSGQEYGVAAALSGDAEMKQDYASGDPYLSFGKRIGAVPSDATKQTHPRERDRLKVCCGLGAMYGAGPVTVAAALGVPTFQAREWLSAHRSTYGRYWEWSEEGLNHALLTGEMRTCYGWRLLVGRDTRGRSLRNFPMQAHGAELMRLAACLATEQGIKVCAPVHDAFLIDADAESIDSETERMQAIMRQASEHVLPGFELRTDAKIVRDGERYSDPRGAEFWERVCGLLDVAKMESEIVVSADLIPA